MGEVVYVDFQCRARTVSNPTFDIFLMDLRKAELDEDDILEVIDAINDPSYYETVDDEIKAIADSWQRYA